MMIKLPVILLGICFGASMANGDAVISELNAEYTFSEDNQIITATPRGTVPDQFFGLHTQGTSTTDRLVTMTNFASVNVAVGRTYTPTADATSKSSKKIYGFSYSGKADTDADDLTNHDIGWWSTDLSNSSCEVDDFLGWVSITLKGAFNLSDSRVSCDTSEYCAVSLPSNHEGWLVSTKASCTTGSSGPSNSVSTISDGVGAVNDSGTRTSAGSYYCFEVETRDATNAPVAWASLSFPCTTVK